MRGKQIRIWGEDLTEFCLFSGARTAENQLPATPSPLRTTCLCAPSARVLRNRAAEGDQLAVDGEEVGRRWEGREQLQQLQNVCWHNLRLLCSGNTDKFTIAVQLIQIIYVDGDWAVDKRRPS